MHYSPDQITDLIQFAIEEGTGEPCSRIDAEAILADWQAA